MPQEARRQLREVIRGLNERLSDPNDLPEMASLDNRQHLFSWTRPFWTVAFCELWSAAILFAWGCQMIIVQGMAATEPVSRALHEFLGMMPLDTGFIMVGLSLIQMVGLFYWNRRIRMLCLFASITIFLFFSIGFMRNLPLYPGNFIIPTYTIVAIIRLFALASRHD